MSCDMFSCREYKGLPETIMTGEKLLELRERDNIGIKAANDMRLQGTSMPRIHTSLCCLLRSGFPASAPKQEGRGKSIRHKLKETIERNGSAIYTEFRTHQAHPTGPPWRREGVCDYPKVGQGFAGMFNRPHYENAANSIQNSGSNIVVEEDLAELFGRSRIAPELASSFKTIVYKPESLTPLAASISLFVGAGPTLLRAKDRSAYFSTTVQCQSKLSLSFPKIFLVAVLLVKRLSNYC